ncbi:hypothetical protein MPSEU_000055900 [Mayamaea pseudoterrestris]|nr:hypothetical protein MPSEU_000055900 [Mayamaea pseudoterrestris]
MHSSVSLTLLFALMLAFTCQAFLVVPPPTPSLKTRLDLHPTQASDLEACAYDLMRQAAAAADAKHHDETAHSVEHKTSKGKGPMAWCRMLLHVNNNKAEKTRKNEGAMELH